MKKAGLLLLCGAFAIALVGWTNSVDARPDYNKVHLAKYKGKDVEAALKEVKCGACHYGKSKKNRNDYGKALIKAGLTKEKYDNFKEDKKDLEKKAAVEAAFKKDIAAALDKVLEGDGGKEFKAKIDAGKLPGTNP